MQEFPDEIEVRNENKQWQDERRKHGAEVLRKCLEGRKEKEEEVNCRTWSGDGEIV